MKPSKIPYLIAALCFGGCFVFTYFMPQWVVDGLIIVILLLMMAYLGVTSSEQNKQENESDE